MLVARSPRSGSSAVGAAITNSEGAIIAVGQNRLLVPQPHGAHTVLTGRLDRSAFYGVLAEIEALGLDLLDVRQLAPRRESPESGDSRSL
jgi:hypothetical protein